MLKKAVGMVGDSVGGMIKNALGIESGTPPRYIPTTSLDDFLSKFTSSEGYFVDTLDPLATFDVEFQFHPHGIKEDEEDPKTLTDSLKKLGSDLLDMGKQMGKNALNNATGGLYSTFTEGGKNDNILDALTTDAKTDISFMQQLMVASKIFNESTDNKDSLHFQLGTYIQGITLPQLKTLGGNKIDNPYLGSFPLVGNAVVPDNNTIALDVLTTKAPLIEYIFYPWMKETTLPYWVYDSQPYTTATIKVDFSKHNQTQYIFTGCRPSNIQMLQPSQEADNGSISRQVTIDFDYMFIYSDLKTIESGMDSIGGAIGSVAGMAGGMLGF